MAVLAMTPEVRERVRRLLRTAAGGGPSEEEQFVGGLMRLAWRAQHDRVRSGSEGMVGEVGRATTELGPPGAARPGKVFVHGEIWNAVSPAPVPAGTPVEVTAITGLLVEVRPLAVARPSAAAGGEELPQARGA